MRTRLFMILGGLAATIGLASCGGSSSLTTGSLIGGGASSSQPAAPKPVTASERALYVGANVARAQRCGFYFDPEQVKTSFLASEEQAGATPEVMQKVTKEFDFTRQSVLAAAAKDDAYCTEGRNREVKAALSRQLAGDFNPPQKRQEINVGWYEYQKKGGTLDGQKVFDAASKTQNPRDQ